MTNTPPAWAVPEFAWYSPNIGQWLGRSQQKAGRECAGRPLSDVRRSGKCVATDAFARYGAVAFSVTTRTSSFRTCMNPPLMLKRLPDPLPSRS